MLPACVSFVLLLGSLNFTSVPVPGFDEKFLGAHAFNLTCTDVVFGASGADWVTNTSVSTTTSGGSMHCYANLTVYAYQGHVHADIVVHPSTITFLRKPSGLGEPDEDFCVDHEFLIDTCAVDATVTQLYADPPSALVDLLLAKARDTANAHFQQYVCSVIVPQMRDNMTQQPLPPPQRNTSAVRTVFPLSDSHLVKAAARVFSTVVTPNALKDKAPFRLNPEVDPERLCVWFGAPAQLRHFSNSLVPADSSVTAVKWLQGIVDELVGERAVPQPFPVFQFPGKVTNLTIDFYLPEDNWNYLYGTGRISVDVTLAGCDENACEVYLDPGVVIVDLDVLSHDSVGMLVSQSFLPPVLQEVNAEIATALRATAVAQHRNVSDPNATVRVTFGQRAVLRQSPKVWPLLLILVCAVSFGVLAIRRNLRLHATEPVRSSATSEPVSTARLVCEDAFVLVSATFCLLLFASSNTMTGASVLLGEELNTYSFSMWNTVMDLWRAGLIPLSICVFVFSGLYPYVKLLSVVYFTVWAQRPMSKRLALIDVLGKFSFIDTFALIVMVSGLEIRNVAHVVIHPAFFFFMFATVASIVLGNYATTLYRRGTSHRMPEDASYASYERVASQDTAASSSSPPSVAATVTPHHELQEQQSSSSSFPARRWRKRGIAALPFLLVHLCTLPAWKFGCLRYTIGGLARAITPTQKTLSLWQLSLLNKWHNFQRTDCMTVSIFAVSLFTILVAPSLFALMPRRGRFLASWCAADVFVVACVAGLLQLHQFITFVLGEGMDDIYTAHATLQWPMLPLAVASLVVWYLIIKDVVGMSWPSKQQHTAATAHGPH